jgi:DNA-binding FadR family transcriptional regulator
MANDQMYPRRGLHGELVHRIGVQIMRGELGPGDAIPADELSAELGLSRTVLREAVKVLAAKGLVEARPKTGTRVRPRAAWNLLDPDVLAWRSEASPDGDFFRNIVELRRIVEPEAAKLAAERATDAEIAAIEAVFAQMEAAVDDLDTFLEHDLLFHELILEGCHNELLAHMAGTMRAVFRALFVATFPRSPRTSRRATALHGEIVAALSERDGPAAEDAMRKLIADTAKRLPQARGSSATSRRRTKSA